MLPTASEYVLLSAQSYYYYRKEGILRSSNGQASVYGTQSLTTKQVSGLGGWTIDLARSYTDPDSGFSATVFHKNGQYVVAYRGTDDWRVGQGDVEQNDTFVPITLGGAGVPGMQTQAAINIVEKMVAGGISLSSIKITVTVHLTLQPP
jgi:hypothetical protein